MNEERADVEVDQPDFGIRIRNLRRDNNLSQQGLAILIGRTEDFVNLIERGLSSVSFVTLKRLRLAFQVSLDSLTDYSGNKAFIEDGGLKWRASKTPSHLVVRSKKVLTRVPRK